MADDDPRPDDSRTEPCGGPLPLPPSVQAGEMTNAIFRVARLHRMLAGQLLRRVGLHPAQELVMMQLWDRGPQRQTDLVRLLGSDAATMTRTVKRLEHAGFVRRHPSDEDKRVTIVEPTAASLAVREQVQDIWAELETSVASQFDAAERTAAIDLLGRIEQALCQATAHGSTAEGPR